MASKNILIKFVKIMGFYDALRACGVLKCTEINNSDPGVAVDLIFWGWAMW